MGAEPWDYFTPFEDSIEAALEKLRDRVFRSGEYRGSEDSPATPQDALENTGADGTASILDILHVSDAPEICSVCRLADDDLVELFGTATPDRATVESNVDVFDDISRGQGRYLVVYKDGKPDEYFLTGYSFD